jgi:hypothetical protein
MKTFFRCIATIVVFCVSTHLYAQDKDLTLEFEGPWAFVQTGTNIVAIAPTGHHSPLQIRGQSGTQLASGIYQFTLSNPHPGSGGNSPPLVPATTKEARLNWLTTHQANMDKERYALSLPAGGAFELPPGKYPVEEASVSDYFDPVGPVPAPYAKDVKIHYAVTDLNVIVSGTPDIGSLLPKQSIMGPISVTVEPETGANHFCDYHARLAFKEMNDLLQSEKFADFPYYWQSCRDNWDPQKHYDRLSGFQAGPPAPEAKKIDTKSAISVLEKMEASTRDLLPKDEASKKTLEDVEAYVKSWSSGEGDYSKGEELAKRMKNVSSKLVDLQDKDGKFRSERLQLLKEIDILAPVIPYGGPSGRNCKAPMMSVTVVP